MSRIQHREAAARYRERNRAAYNEYQREYAQRRKQLCLKRWSMLKIRRVAKKLKQETERRRQHKHIF